MFFVCCLISSQDISETVEFIGAQPAYPRWASFVAVGIQMWFKVFGIIKPRDGAEKIVNSFAEDLHNLHSHYFLALNAGANDIYKNNKRIALIQITNFVQGNYGTNIIILDVPLRYDLPPSSYVNSQTNEFNRTLKKLLLNITMFRYWKHPLKENVSWGMGYTGILLERRW
jgi:hypothetical protein